MIDFKEGKPSKQQLQALVDYIEEHHGRLSYAMIADPALPLSPTTSRVGGLPYWNFAQEYPCDDRGEPLCFLCQINLQEVANTPLGDKLQDLRFKDSAELLPSKGLLQFFALKDEQFGCTFGSDSKLSRVVYIEDISEGQNLTMEQLRLRIAEQGLDESKLSNLQEIDELYWPITGEIALRFQAVRAVPNYGDFSLRAKVIAEAVNAVFGLNLQQDSQEMLSILDMFDEDEEGDFDFNEHLSNTRSLSKQDANCSIGWLLGYPDFTQDNPIPWDESLVRFDTLLLCLDGSSKVGENFSMLWGDCGIADFFINGEKLARKDFSDTFYTWDCC